jgi:hypothetical protein
MSKTYRLKPGMESFDVVDGAYAGRRFLKGLDYTDIPPGEAGKFEEIASTPRGADGGSEGKKTSRPVPRLVKPEHATDVKEE